jgi:type IV pilus assembly protein PilY1
MYMARGFGYDNGNNQCWTAACNGNSYWAPVVPMTSAGQYPTTATVNTAIAAFTPLLAPETNSTNTSEVKAVAEQSPLAGLLQNAQAYYTNANPQPSVPGCSVQRYVVLMTDGLPTQGDTLGDSWPPPGTTAAAEYGETVVFNGDGSLNTAATNDKSLVQTINVLTAMKNAGIQVYIVGLGSGVSANPAAAEVLTAMAIAGGTTNYFPATSTVALTQALQTILGDVQAATQSVSSSAINSTGIHQGSVVYQAQFTTKDKEQDWTGNLFAFPINPSTGFVDTNPADAQWQAQSLLDSQPWQTGGAGRIIATWDPAANAGLGGGAPFEWTTGTPSSGIATSTTLGQDLMTNPADTSGQDALDYLRGDRALEQDANPAGPYRTRTHVLGDIVDSAPIYIGPPQGLYQGASYTTFQQTWMNRPPVIYVGGNDGMLHAFDAATGIERFAFIPHAVFSNLIDLTYPTYNENHRFFVDGSPQAWDVQFSDNSWHTILVSPEGAGGKSLFALDVTNPAGIINETSLANSVLWEFTDGNMGLTFGPPSLALTNAGSLLFVGNGYDSPTEQPYVYALNPQNGSIVAKLNLCSFAPSACNAAMPNGLSTVTLVNSTGSLSGPANVLYAGDLQGNVWRVDISNASTSNWTASVLFQATDPSGNPQPITTQPVVSLNPDFPRLAGTMVFVGTGQLLATTDLTTTQTESLYGLYDAMPNASVITKASLVQQTLSTASVTTVSGSTVDAVAVSSNLVSLPTQMGWYLNFSLNAGERVITDPVLYSGALIITTNQPTTSDCETTTNSWFYEFNYMDGGRFPGPMFDVTESGGVSSSEPNVAGVFLGNVYSSGARITSGSLGNGTAGMDILINESGNSTVAGSYSSFGQNQLPACNGGPSVCGDPITGILGKGGGQSRTAWWEIR